MKISITFYVFLISAGLLLNSCSLKQIWMSQKNTMNLVAEKSSKKNVYNKNEHQNYFLKQNGKISQGDTIDFYLNGDFLFSRIISADRKFKIPLEKAAFGENLIAALLKRNDAYKFEQFITVLPENEPIDLAYEILAEFEHNPNDFTQGLIAEEDTIFESTGGYGSSYIKKYNIRTGELYNEFKLPNHYFGEGVTKIKEQLYLLTYKENKILIFEPYKLTLLKERHFFSEGWGITNNFHQLIVSNGSSNIYFLDPNTLEVVKTLKIYDNKGEVTKINELEYINGEIYANIWHKDEIVIIDPSSGAVTKKLDFNELVKTYKKGILSEKVLNGIAYDSIKDNLYITGKRWPVIFKIAVVDQQNISFEP